ncbi:PIN domain-like protein [Mycena haematopus]|nr:PIN domain-like protein [Mycena haematopus]
MHSIPPTSRRPATRGRSSLEVNPKSFASAYTYAKQLEKAELKQDRWDFATVHGNDRAVPAEHVRCWHTEPSSRAQPPPPTFWKSPTSSASTKARCRWTRVAVEQHQTLQGDTTLLVTLATMGLPNFWQLVELSSQSMSFRELCAQEGFIENRREIGTMLVGVDANLWLGQCQMMFHKPNHAQMGSNPELRALFFKLVALHHVGVTAVFVFDGRNRPSIKRDKQVKDKPHWLVTEFTELIELFGFHHYTVLFSPAVDHCTGEADAELAYLNRFEYIDAVFSDDGDVALFGARRIFRRFTGQEEPDEITVYTSDALQNTAGIELTQGGILLLAIMSGGGL